MVFLLTIVDGCEIILKAVQRGRSNIITMLRFKSQHNYRLLEEWVTSLHVHTS